MSVGVDFAAHSIQTVEYNPRVAITGTRTRQRTQGPNVGRMLRLFTLAGILVVVVLAIGLLLLTAAVVNAARSDETAPADAIVVLGAAQWNGRPSTTFRARLDHALKLYEQGLAPKIVLTGGIGEGDRYAEAEVGQDYLANRGVPASAMETVGGLTSWENLQQAREVLDDQDSRTVLLVSDAFHMFRVKRMADDLGLTGLASPTQTSPIRESSPLEYRYIAREVGAYIAYLFFDRSR